jgi:hypothetical protein
MLPLTVHATQLPQVKSNGFDQDQKTHAHQRTRRQPRSWGFGPSKGRSDANLTKITNHMTPAGGHKLLTVNRNRPCSNLFLKDQRGPPQPAELAGRNLPQCGEP